MLMIKKFNQLTNIIFLLCKDVRDSIDLSGIVRNSGLFFIFIIVLELYYRDFIMLFYLVFYYDFIMT
jgi:hypothetical protein